jgi:hypothetical protein
MSESTVDARPEDLVREVEAVLSRRVDVLERENRNLKRNSVLMIVGVGIMVALSATMLLSMRAAEGRVAESVEARRFVLRDGSGAVRGVLGMTADGATRLVLQDGEGRERMKLTLLADGSPGIAFADREGRSRAVLGLLADETSTLVFADRRGRTRAVFGLSPDESSTLVFVDPNGDARVGVGVEADGTAGMTLFEREPAPRVGGLAPLLGTEDGAEPSSDAGVGPAEPGR